MSQSTGQTPAPGYRRIVDALDDGRRALARARLTAGALRFLGTAVAVVAALVLWAAIQRALRFYSVPVASAASILGAAILVFALVRWVVVPLIRLPGRDRFVALVEARYPEERNLVVNAYQLGDPARRDAVAGSADLVDALVAHAASRIEGLDIRRWRDPAPDRPFLWAGGAAVVVVAVLGFLSPSLLSGALGQVLRPSLAQAPPVTLAVRPGDVEVDRGADVEVLADVRGTDHAPDLEFRERNGEWRVRPFTPVPGATADGENGDWTATLENVDRALEYRVKAPRAESPVYAVRVKEPPRIAGFRVSLAYPAYTGLAPETIEGGSGDLAAIKGTVADVRVLTNRPLAAGYLDWRVDGAESGERRPLVAVDATTWEAPWTVLESGSYAVVFTDETGRETLRSPRYRVEPAWDRAPFLTLHLPQEDHDLYDDMMERIVADAADDFGFSACRVVYRIDDGEEHATPFRPYTAGQKEFRLDTLWDLKGLGLMPGGTLSFYVEVLDNDAVSGAKAARSEVRRVRFPTVGEMYAEVAEEQGKEIGTLSDVHEEQQDIRERLEKLSDELKAGKELDWDLKQDLQSTLDRQTQLEQQVQETLDRLGETLSKASDRAGMQQDLVNKMAELNDLLKNLQDADMHRSFERLSDALTRMNRDQIRDALENYRGEQQQMLQGLDRTVELLKQIRKEGQVEDVVNRTDEIARLQEEIAAELEKMGMKPEDKPAGGDTAGDEAKDAEKGDASKPQDPDGEKADAGEKGKQGEQGDQGEKADRADAGDAEAMTPEMQKLAEEIQKLQQQIADERAKAAESSMSDADREKAEAMLQDLKDRLEQQMAENRSGEPSESEQRNRESQQNEQGQQAQQGDQSQQSQQGEQSQEGQQQNQSGEKRDSKPQDSARKGSKSDEEKLRDLARREQELQQKIEELKRQLETLKKLNRDDQQLSQDLDDLQKGNTTQKLQQSVQDAQEGMQSGQKKESSTYAFRARDEARRLAQQAQKMQQQMADRLEDDSQQKMEAIIRGLIDVSGAGQTLLGADEPDEQALAGRQFFLLERTQAWSESLNALARQTFAVRTQQVGKLGDAMTGMERATRLYEQGDLVNGRHEGSESTSDINETLVELMQSHQQMCSGQGGGDSQQQMLDRMKGLSDAQQGLNEQTGEAARRREGQGRLSMSDEQRLKWLAAQQEMIRKGMQEMREQFADAKDLLGDLDKVEDQMKSVEQSLANDRDISPEVLKRQQEILSRMLDAQRSIRQQEMSPERESRTGTLAQRRTPPELPDELLHPERTLEEDVLRGANDRYPSQYRRLVEEYFRSLAKETHTP